MHPGIAHRIINLEEHATGPLDTAAAIMNLDLIITVDTMVAHLAGALGKPVWLLLAFQADWRWMVERDDSPWYPTMRLFRQSRPGDWHEPMERIRRALVPLWTARVR
jgi:ADP-heptose:LPS heptosyltransferase